MKKLAAVAVVCGVLMGCEHKHTTPPEFRLGSPVLVHGTLQGTIVKRWHYSTDCTYNYTIVLDNGTKVNIMQRHLSPFVRKRKLCLTTRSEMGIFHPCSKKEHNLNSINKEPING